MRRLRSLSVYLFLVCCILYISPRVAFATSPTTVVFLSGLCNNSQTCNAQQIAANSIQPKLAPGTTLLAPDAKDGYAPGHFGNEGAANTFAQKLNGQNLVFIAYSAGDWGLAQIINHMSDEQLKQIKSVILLERGNPNISSGPIARLQKVNPNVKVYSMGTAQFGGNHSSLPGSAGLADTVSQLATAAANNAPSTLPANFASTPLSSAVQTAMNSAQSLPASQSYAPSGQQYSYAATPVSQTSPSSYGNSLLYPASYAPTSQSGNTAYAPATSFNPSTLSDLYTSQQMPTSAPTNGPHPTAYPSRPPSNQNASSTATSSRTQDTAPQTFPPNDQLPPISNPSTTTPPTTTWGVSIEDTIVQILSKIRGILQGLQDLVQ